MRAKSTLLTCTLRMKLLTAHPSLKLLTLHHCEVLLFLHRPTTVIHTVILYRLCHCCLHTAQGDMSRRLIQRMVINRNDQGRVIECTIPCLCSNYPIRNRHRLGQSQEEANKIIRHRQLNPPLRTRRRSRRLRRPKTKCIHYKLNCPTWFFPLCWFVGGCSVVDG